MAVDIDPVVIGTPRRGTGSIDAESRQWGFDMTDPVDPALLEQQVRKAKIEADKLQKEFEEWKDSAAARAKEGEAKLEQLAQENDERRVKNEESARNAWKDVVPEIPNQRFGETKVSEGKTMFSALLATRAIEEAAAAVAKTLSQRLSGSAVVLITADHDLVSRVALYRQTLMQIKTVEDLLTLVEGPPGPAPTDGAELVRMIAAAGPAGVVAGVASAAAKLIPGVLGLISANRTVATQESTPDDVVVTMAVAGALKAIEPSLKVSLDKTRVLDDVSDLMTTWGRMQQASLRLARDIALEESKEPSAQGAWLKEAKIVVALARELIVGLTSVPDGATRSALASAAVEEILTEASTKYVLVVRPAGASATQLVSDRPLAFKDPVHITATAGIAFALVDTWSSEVVFAGVKTGDAELVGSIGSRLRLAAE